MKISSWEQPGEGGWGGLGGEKGGWGGNGGDRIEDENEKDELLWGEGDENKDQEERQ